LIVNISKTGDKTNCENYQGISLLSIAEKIFGCFLACHLFLTAEEALPESECGFRTSQGTVDMIQHDRFRKSIGNSIKTFIWLLLI